MKKLVLLVLIILSIQLKAQEQPNKFDIRFGVGTSLLGSGDVITLNFENEVNYDISQYFASSFTLNYGRSNKNTDYPKSYIQLNLNIFISPFKNSKKNDFRIGTGFSYMNISEGYPDYGGCGTPPVPEPVSPLNNTIGINFIIEDTYLISERFLIGLKLFSQSYNSGDINSGILLKFGLVL